jgi:hypothetical protein
MMVELDEQSMSSYISEVAELDAEHAPMVVLPGRVEVETSIGDAVLVMKNPRSDADGPVTQPRLGELYLAREGVVVLPGRFGRRIPVDVELAPWSQDRTEVALRLRRVGFPRYHESRYAEVATAVVEALAADLSRPAGAIKGDADRLAAA